MYLFLSTITSGFSSENKVLPVERTVVVLRMLKELAPLILITIVAVSELGH